MKAKAVPISWLERDGRRLDCNPYMSGALEAKVLLDRLKAKKERLADLTAGYKGGIYNGPQFKRNYVDSPDHGVQFLTGGDVLSADTSRLPLLSRRDAHSPKLSYLRLEPGMTIISCSGAIGRMAYVRDDLAGVWSSQDVLKVVPDSQKIPPGFIHAYLSSKFGVPLVVSGTYGAIIQHIEPAHVADLPVPRLGKNLEQRAHELVTSAANARSEAVKLLAQADATFIEVLSLPKPKRQAEYNSPYIACASSAQFLQRGDGFYYASLNSDARRAFDSAKSMTTLGEVADVFIPGIFKREYASDPAFGVPYITGGDVFQLAATSEQYLLRRIANDLRLVLRKGMVVIQEAGQLGGLIGRSVLVGEHLDGFACSNNMVRVTAKNEANIGYLFATLASTYGVRLVSREGAGSSIPHIEAGRIRDLSIPWPAEEVRIRIGKPVMDAQRLRDKAVSAEREARALVEGAIENGKC